jgi:hypothetical protein
MLQGNKSAAAAFPNLWDTVAANWWYRVTGIYEIHVTFDEDLGWEVAVHENGVIKTRPSFRKDFNVAVTLAESLFKHYESKREEEVTS